MLCFILDIPHWGRYFHDCDKQENQKLKVESSKQVRSAIPSNVPGRIFAGVPEDLADPFTGSRNLTIRRGPRKTGQNAASIDLLADLSALEWRFRRRCNTRPRRTDPPN